MRGPGILTDSGRFVGRDGGDVPSLSDIALSLSRQPRFGGHCRVNWSVLDHTLFVEKLVHFLGSGDRLARLMALLHDAHEAVTGDIPQPMKSEAIKDLQDELDHRIFRAYAGRASLAYLEIAQAEVIRWDHAALLAEAFCVGPRTLTPVGRVEEYFGATPDAAVVNQLWLGLGCAGSVLTPAQSRTEFIQLYTELI